MNWKARFRRNVVGYLFIAPNLILFAVFILWPLVFSFVLSFTEWNVLGDKQFVGLKNFITLFQDDWFWGALGNTFYFVFVAVPLRTLAGLIAALMIFHVRRMNYLFRVLYFFPYISMLVAVSLIFMWLFDPDFGLINYLLSLVGVQGPAWLQSRTWAMPSIILLSVWKNFGYIMIIYLASIISLPGELFEAAEIDGALWYHRIWNIMLPLLSPTTLFVVTVQLIFSFQVFPEVFIMTQGGPSGATYTVVYGVYERGFAWFKMGYASSWAWMLFVCILSIVIVQWRLRKRWVFTYV
jgi:multiple sugar transport system permease protein